MLLRSRRPCSSRSRRWACGCRGVTQRHAARCARLVRGRASGSARGKRIRVRRVRRRDVERCIGPRGRCRPQPDPAPTRRLQSRLLGAKVDATSGCRVTLRAGAFAPCIRRAGPASRRDRGRGRQPRSEGVARRSEAQFERVARNRLLIDGVSRPASVFSLVSRWHVRERAIRDGDVLAMFVQPPRRRPRAASMSIDRAIVNAWRTASSRVTGCATERLRTHRSSYDVAVRSRSREGRVPTSRSTACDDNREAGRAVTRGSAK